jgi:hypothetical protein
MVGATPHLQTGCLVQLRYASLPFIGAFAAHYWFVVIDGNQCDRWEVWQTPNAGGVSIGHVHCNLKDPDADVGGGPSCVAAAWNGDEARRLLSVLSAAFEAYPYRDRYLPWPGPNSNTFVAWVLRAAEIDFPLHWRALGKDYGQV